jgi:hypothetical protein
MSCIMVTIATELQEDLALKLEKLALEKGVSTSELLSGLAAAAIARQEAQERRILQDIDVYKRFPVLPGEFLEWDEEDEAWTKDEY